MTPAAELLCRSIPPLCLLRLPFVARTSATVSSTDLVFPIAWATRTLIARKLKGLEELVRKFHFHEHVILPTYSVP